MSGHRRAFLADVGRGMLAASLGSVTALDLGLTDDLLAGEKPSRLTFGALEPLVSLMQETPPDRLQRLLVQKLQTGTELQTLVTAGALANARAFGGQDYTGYHTFMALVPAYQMARELPFSRSALPVLKVLYRNSSRIQEQKAAEADVLHPVAMDAAAEAPSGADAGEALRASVRAVDWQGAEARFAGLTQASANEAFQDLQWCVQDDVNVHRVVLAWRAWAMLELSGGQQYAHTLLRQSVRFCLDSEQSLRDQDRPAPAVRETLPRLLDQYRLLSRPLGSRRADDAWVEQHARQIAKGTREQAADAVAAALADGIHPEDVGEAISVAANLLVLHDPGRLEKYSSAQKPPGCVHGDSVGVHASDAANAWRNIARVSSQRNKVASLVVGAFHTAGQSAWIGKDPYPYTPLLAEFTARDSQTLLGQAEEAIKANDQARACAVAHRYLELELATRPLFDLLLKYAVSEDGALHAEKYYRTVVEEFAATRPTLRSRQLVALARVTASEFGFPAPGYQDACGLLGLT